MRAKTREDNEDNAVALDDSVVELPSFSLWPRRDTVEFYEHRDLQAEIDELYRNLDTFSRKLFPHYINQCDAERLMPVCGSVITGAEFGSSPDVLRNFSQYLFVVTSDGELSFCERISYGQINFHNMLAQGKTVIAAGELDRCAENFNLSFQSGHYRPFESDALRKYIKNKFLYYLPTANVMFSPGFAKNVRELFGDRAIDFLGRLDPSMKDKVSPALAPYIGTGFFPSKVLIPWLMKSKPTLVPNFWLEAFKKSVQSTSSNNEKIEGVTPTDLDWLQRSSTENPFQHLQSISTCLPEQPKKPIRLFSGLLSLFMSEAAACETRPSSMLIANAVDNHALDEEKKPAAMKVHYLSRPLLDKKDLATEIKLLMDALEDFGNRMRFQYVNRAVDEKVRPPFDGVMTGDSIRHNQRLLHDLPDSIDEDGELIPNHYLYVITNTGELRICERRPGFNLENYHSNLAGNVPIVAGGQFQYHAGKDGENTITFDFATGHYHVAECQTLINYVKEKFAHCLPPNTKIIFQHHDSFRSEYDIYGTSIQEFASHLHPSMRDHVPSELRPLIGSKSKSWVENFFTKMFFGSKIEDRNVIVPWLMEKPFTRAVTDLKWMTSRPSALLEFDSFCYLDPAHLIESQKQRAVSTALEALDAELKKIENRRPSAQSAPELPKFSAAFEYSVGPNGISAGFKFSDNVNRFDYTVNVTFDFSGIVVDVLNGRRLRSENYSPYGTNYVVRQKFKSKHFRELELEVINSVTGEKYGATLTLHLFQGLDTPEGQARIAEHLAEYIDTDRSKTFHPDKAKLDSDLDRLLAVETFNLEEAYRLCAEFCKKYANYDGPKTVPEIRKEKEQAERAEKRKKKHGIEPEKKPTQIEMTVKELEARLKRGIGEANQKVQEITAQYNQDLAKYQQLTKEQDQKIESGECILQFGNAVINLINDYASDSDGRFAALDHSVRLFSSDAEEKLAQEIKRDQDCVENFTEQSAAIAEKIESLRALIATEHSQKVGIESDIAELEKIKALADQQIQLSKCNQGNAKFRLALYDPQKKHFYTQTATIISDLSFSILKYGLKLDYPRGEQVVSCALQVASHYFEDEMALLDPVNRKKNSFLAYLSLMLKMMNGIFYQEEIDHYVLPPIQFYLNLHSPEILLKIPQIKTWLSLPQSENYFDRMRFLTGLCLHHLVHHKQNPTCLMLFMKLLEYAKNSASTVSVWVEKATDVNLSQAVLLLGKINIPSNYIAWTIATASVINICYFEQRRLAGDAPVTFIPIMGEELCRHASNPAIAVPVFLYAANATAINTAIQNITPDVITAIAATLGVKVIVATALVVAVVQYANHCAIENHLHNIETKLKNGGQQNILDAESEIAEVLKQDPNNKKALEFKDKIDAQRREEANKLSVRTTLIEVASTGVQLFAKAIADHCAVARAKANAPLPAWSFDTALPEEAGTRALKKPPVVNSLLFQPVQKNSFSTLRGIRHASIL